MTDTHDSYLQSDARQEAISAQKELFLRGLPVDTTVVSDFVLRSWQRSRLAGVDPETTVRKKVDETIFRHILAANADLLECSGEPTASGRVWRSAGPSRSSARSIT